MANSAFYVLPVVEAIPFRYLCDRHGVPSRNYIVRCLGSNEARTVYVTHISSQCQKIYNHAYWLTEFEKDLPKIWFAVEGRCEPVEPAGPEVYRTKARPENPGQLATVR